MAYSLAPFIKQRFFDTNGDPLAGGLLYTYQSGTTTPQATYTDSTGGTPNANPVVLDANGEANVWTDVALSYKYVLKNSSGATQWTVDNVIGLITNNAVSTASIQDSAVTTAKLADDSVTAAKLADDASIDANRAVTANHIRDAVITNNKLDATTTTSSDEIRNLGLTASIATNAMTIALKTKAGTDPSATDYVNVGFRDSSITVGTYNIRKISSALSVVVPASTTLGSVSAVAEYYTIALIDNAGTPELAIGLGVFIDEGALISTTAIAGGATRGTLYSTTARSSVPVRVIGRVLATEATAGTWATSPAAVSIAPFSLGSRSQVRLHTSSTRGGSSSGETAIRNFTTTIVNAGTAITYTARTTTTGDKFTINEDGVYAISTHCGETAASGAGYVGISLNSSELSTSIDAMTVVADRLSVSGYSGAADGMISSCTWVGFLAAGSVIRCHAHVSLNPTNAALAQFSICQMSR